jgi:hypothetical protein
LPTRVDNSNSSCQLELTIPTRVARRRSQLGVVFPRCTACSSLPLRPLRLSPGERTYPSSPLHGLILVPLWPDVADRSSCWVHVSRIQRPAECHYWLRRGAPVDATSNMRFYVSSSWCCETFRDAAAVELNTVRPVKPGPRRLFTGCRRSAALRLDRSDVFVRRSSERLVQLSAAASGPSVGVFGREDQAW